MITPQTDAILLSKYLKGEEKSLEKLIHKYGPRVIRFIRSKVHDYDLANDIFQETMMKVIVTIKSGKYNNDGKFISWVMTIAYHLIIDHFRKDKRTRTMLAEYLDSYKPEATEANALSNMIKQEEQTELRQLITNLPPEQIEIINMRIFEQKSFKEIALEKNISINTALGRMRYGVLKLKKLKSA